MCWSCSDNNHVLEAAIRTAADREILMFSSVEDTGRFRDIGFPANLPNVFGVSAAKSNGKLFEFNPLSSTSSYNFSFPGEGMKGLSPETSGADIASTTSFATAVAAGVAGNLLDFFRQPVCQNLREHPITIADIGSVFDAMTIHYMGQLRYVAPWELLRKTLGSQDRAEKRAQLALLFSQVGQYHFHVAICC